MAKTSTSEDISQEVSQCLDAALSRLKQIWNEIGIRNEERQKRVHVVSLHVRNLLDEMVEEEDNLKKKLLCNVDKYGQELLTLCQELSLPPYEPSHNATILQLERELSTKVYALSREKHERIKNLKRLRDQDQHLCDILCSTPYYVPSGSVPSNDQLKELEQHIASLKEEKEKRFKQFTSTKSSIMKLLEDLEQSPNTSFAREVICEEEESILLSTENMKALRIWYEELEQKQKENFSLASQLRDKLVTLWERLKISEEEQNAFSTDNTGFKPRVIQNLRDEIERCEVLKLENMKTVIEGARKELDEWWDKCFCSQEQRQEFAAYRTDECTEELLDLHDKEVQRWKSYYEENSEMLDKVAKRQVLWKEYLEFERKASDPNRLFNRGWNALKEEKIRKKLMKDLPRLEEEVKEAIDVWEKKHKKQFLVEGVRFVDYIKTQRETNKLQKEIEKEQRHRAKTKELEQELMYGSKPVTPAKRRFNTPAKSPASKQRKLNDTSKTPGQKTPGSVSKLGRPNHTSLFMSPVALAPKSASKTPHRQLRSNRQPSARKALSEKNTTNEIFSHTTVSSGGAQSNLSSVSLASVGQYNEFAKGLNGNSRPNCRSSVIPNPQAYF